MKKIFSFSSIIMFFSLLFLFLPLVVVVIYSFNSGKGMVFEEFSLKWYIELFTSSPALWKSLLNSVIIALSSALSATIIGTLAAIGVKWFFFKSRTYVATISYLPMVLPEVIIGISMLIFFASINVSLSMFTIFIAHTTFNLPFVYLLINARLDEFDYSAIEAAKDLGASEKDTLFKIIVPSILPGILSSLLICITMSIEDFVITFFVSGPGSATLPLYVYSSIRYGVSPVINALSFILILVTMLIAFSGRKFLKTIAARS